jgi:hypothetical protein
VETDYCGISKIGILFSTVNYNAFNPSPINGFAHIYCDSIITDTLNWITVKGSFVADSNYSFITIGSFFTDEHIDSLQLSGSICRSYYFVDDVCVSTDSFFCSDYKYVGTDKATYPKEISVYPNPSRDFVNIDFSFLNGPHDITMYDEFGRMIFIKENTMNSVEHIPINNINSSFLLLKISNRNGTFNYKILKL